MGIVLKKAEERRREISESWRSLEKVSGPDTAIDRVIMKAKHKATSFDHGLMEKGWNKYYFLSSASRVRYPTFYQELLHIPKKDIAMANTLIFGGSGKVARHITRMLAAEGHNVYSIIVSPGDSPRLMKDVI